MQIEAVRTADVAIMNGRVWTGKGGSRDPEKGKEPVAIAIADGRIEVVGDGAAVRSRLGPGTKIINAKGHRVIPGITDSHTHLIGGGFQLARLNLRDARNKDEFIAQIAAAAKEKKKGEWVLGGRWSVESWERPESPTRQWLDPVTGDTPVFLSRMDGHGALANSAALKLAGIDASGPPDPKGGEIERDPKTKGPTGILKESAMELVSRHILEPTTEQRYEALQRAMKHANSFGITSVHDMCDQEHPTVFRKAETDKSLTLRITAYVTVADVFPESDVGPARGGSGERSPVDSVLSQIAEQGAGSDLFRVAGIKAYMDGSLGSRTAYMREPFSDATPDMPYPRGQLTATADPPDSFRRLIRTAVGKNLQTAVHAIGDEGNHLLLDTYEDVTRISSRGPLWLRDEHTQHLLVEDIPRFAKIGVVASMQPYHKADDGRYAEKAIGTERLKGSYAFRQLVDSGALVIFGSDWPVVTMNPFAGIDSAVNARTLAGDVWLPSHSLTVAEALYAYTVSPPKAVHRDDRLGTIEKGKLADIVILMDDPFTMPKEKLAEVRVAQTIVGGKVVYSAEDKGK